jgi:hypothetical protein
MNFVDLVSHHLWFVIALIGAILLAQVIFLAVITQAFKADVELSSSVQRTIDRVGWYIVTEGILVVLFLGLMLALNIFHSTQ